MSILEQNKGIVQRIFKEFWLDGRTSVLDQLLATDVTNHELSKEPLAGRDGYKEWANGFRQVTAAGFPDREIVVDALVAEGDLVAKRWTFRGTHTGEYMGLPASGKKVVMTGITIYRIAGAQVHETWWSYDALGMMQQLGAIPGATEQVGARA
jgi:steroid delta-isomerase-like uncharacterized protein